MTNQFLENERIVLEEKITEARNKGNENTYKNLIQAYERILELIRKENKWEDMYSHYYEGDEKLNGENEYVATWKQNWNGDIKDHKVYKVEKEVSTLKINLKVGHYEINNDILTIPIQVGEKHNFAIKGKKVGDMWVLDNANTIKCN